MGEIPEGIDSSVTGCGAYEEVLAEFGFGAGRDDGGSLFKISRCEWGRSAGCGAAKAEECETDSRFCNENALDSLIRGSSELLEHPKGTTEENRGS